MNLPLAIPARQQVNQGVDNFTSGLYSYLEELGLPKDKVLVSTDERQRVINNLPEVITLIDIEKRGKSVYLSKFIAACGAGLFDAALNFIWDETVVNLRTKVARFDLEYFFDSVITDPNRRSKFKDESDLVKIEEWELIRGCHLTGILSDIGFKHLDYIRDMRNWASAAHPNQNDLTGFQLISWLETCMKEVIAREPEGPVVEIKRFLFCIRNTTLSTSDATHINAGIEHLPPDLATSLLRTLFGMYTNTSTSSETKNNIKLVSKKCWTIAQDDIKYECGFKYSTFATNGETERKNLANEYLTVCGGLPYLPKDTLALEMSEKIQNLYTAHTGWNNFHNEPAHAKSLFAYISTTGSIPEAVRKPYVKTITMTKMGNGYGVSTLAESYYDKLISMFGEYEIKEFVFLPMDTEFASRISLSVCASNFRSLAQYFASRTTNQITGQALAAICSSNDKQIPFLGKDTNYKILLAAYNV